MRILICLLFSIVAVDFATAGCKINLRVKNETDNRIVFSGGWRDSEFKVKTRALPWVHVKKRGWLAEDWVGSYYVPDRSIGMPEAWILEPGDTALDMYEAVLGCNVNRRYRLQFKCIKEDGYFDPQKNRYFPGPAKWTRNTNVTIPL